MKGSQELKNEGINWNNFSLIFENSTLKVMERRLKFQIKNFKIRNCILRKIRLKVFQDF